MKNRFIYLLLVLSLVSCSIIKNSKSSENSDKEEEYFRIFTEATNQAIIGNIKNAVELYNYCVKFYPEKAAPFYQLSQLYLKANNKNASKYFAIKAIELDENNKWYILNLASIYEYEKNVDSLIYLYEKLVKISNDVEYEYQLANLYGMQGSYRKALYLTKHLENSVDGSKELKILEHQLYNALNLKDSAVFALEDLINLYPDDNDSYGLLAEYLGEINQYDKANDVYKELLKREPENGLANVSYADFFMKQDKSDSALKYYKKGFQDKNISYDEKSNIVYGFIENEKSVVKDSNLIVSLIETLKLQYLDSRPFVLAAELYLKLKNFNLTLISLKSAIDLGNSNYAVWEKYILMCNYLNKNEEVKSIYPVALRKFPNAVKLYIYSAYSLYNLKDYTAVVTLCDSSLTIKKIQKDEKIQLLNFLADSYRELEKYDISDSIYEEIIKIDPNNLLIRNNYSYYLSLRKKNLERARELSEYTIKIEPRNASYLDTYGWIIFQMGNSKEAIKYIEAAIRNGASNNSDVLEHYGDIMLDLKRCTEAIEAWKEAIKYKSGEKIILQRKIGETESNCGNE
jgi:tetratricopeptide (TPR) repeat protein